MDGHVAVNRSEKQASHGGREGGNDPCQLEEENTGAVFPVEDVEVKEAVHENDAADQVGHGQAANEVVRGAGSKGVRVEDHAQHHKVLEHRKCPERDGQDDNHKLLCRGKDHETLHVVHNVLPALGGLSAAVTQ